MIADLDTSLKWILKDARRHAKQDEGEKHRTYLELRRRVECLDLRPDGFEAAMREVIRELRY